METIKIDKPFTQEEEAKLQPGFYQSKTVAYQNYEDTNYRVDSYLARINADGLLEVVKHESRYWGSKPEPKITAENIEQQLVVVTKTYAHGLLLLETEKALPHSMDLGHLVFDNPGSYKKLTYFRSHGKIEVGTTLVDAPCVVEEEWVGKTFPEGAPKDTTVRSLTDFEYPDLQVGITTYFESTFADGTTKCKRTAEKIEGEWHYHYQEWFKNGQLKHDNKWNDKSSMKTTYNKKCQLVKQKETKEVNGQLVTAILEPKKD